uniref:GetN n=1 Tax=Streptomyces sp. L-49973 TaxID=762837 RepID=E0WFM7_9ACTN|nr:GetN [Streptomyces sp. L-49973]
MEGTAKDTKDTKDTKDKKGKKDRLIAYRRAGNESATRLFFLPYAGKGASGYREIADSFGPEVEPVLLQTPGRENRLAEPAVDDIDALVTQLATALRGHLDAPFALFGHSMGSLVAFELAAHLERTEPGLPGPVALFVSAESAPHLLVPPEVTDEQLTDEQFLADRTGLEAARRRPRRAQPARLPRVALPGAARGLHRPGGLPAAVRAPVHHHPGHGDVRGRGPRGDGRGGGDLADALRGTVRGRTDSGRPLLSPDGTGRDDRRTRPCSRPLGRTDLRVFRRRTVLPE